MAHSSSETFPSLKANLLLCESGGKSTYPPLTSVVGRPVVCWSAADADGDDGAGDNGSQNNANLFSRGCFQLPFLPGGCVFILVPRIRHRRWFRGRVKRSFFIVPDVPISDTAAIFLTAILLTGYNAIVIVAAVVTEQAYI